MSIVVGTNRPPRPQQDRSINLRDTENNQLIDYFRSKDIVVRKI